MEAYFECLFCIKHCDKSSAYILLFNLFNHLLVVSRILNLQLRKLT